MVAELAVGISRRLQTTLSHDVNETGYFFHSFQGPFDEACYVLWELDVARADPGDGGPGISWADDRSPFAAAFCFFPANEMRACITSRAPLPQAMIDRVLAAFVSVACDYGPAGSTLSVGRAPFKPQAEYECEIAALAACDYVECSGELIKWTEKIAHAMETKNFWDASGVVPIPREIRLSTSAERQVTYLLQHDQCIAAIAVVRSDAGATLLEAKQYIEQIERLGTAARNTN